MKEQQEKNITLRKILSLLGYAEAIGMTFILFHIVINAYLNDYKWVVYINRQGEALIELIMFIIILPIMVIGFYYYLKDLKIISKVEQL